MRVPFYKNIALRNLTCPWAVSVGVLIAAIMSAPVATHGGQAKTDVARLIKELADPNQKVNEAAAAALEKIGLDALDEITKAYAAGDSKRKGDLAKIMGPIRQQAIEQKKTKTAEAIEDLLVDALKQEKSYYIVIRAARSATMAPPSKKALPVLIEILRKQKKNPGGSTDEEMSVQHGLLQYGPEAAAAIPDFLEIAARLTNERIRRMHCLGTAYVLGPKDDRVFAAANLLSKDEKDDVHVRQRALGILARMGERGQAALPYAVKMLKETTREKTRDDADYLMIHTNLVITLGQFKLAKAEYALLVEIANAVDEDRITRREAIIALAKCAATSEDAWAPLIQTLNANLRDDPLGPSGCYHVVNAIGKMEPPADKKSRAFVAEQMKRAFDILVRIDDSPGFRREMETALKRIQAP